MVWSCVCGDSFNRKIVCVNLIESFQELVNFGGYLRAIEISLLIFGKF